MTRQLHLILVRALALIAVSLLAISACGRAEKAVEAADEKPVGEMTGPAPAPQPEPIPVPPDVAAVPADAQRSASGLAWKVLVPGTGTEHPKATSVVEVHYSGWTTDGRMFDSSRVGGATASFPLNRVIAGWTEGVQLMVTGEHRRFWIPPELAYKNSTRPGAPQGTLVFDIELIAIKD